MVHLNHVLEFKDPSGNQWLFAHIRHGPFTNINGSYPYKHRLSEPLNCQKWAIEMSKYPQYLDLSFERFWQLSDNLAFCVLEWAVCYRKWNTFFIWSSWENLTHSGCDGPNVTLFINFLYILFIYEKYGLFYIWLHSWKPENKTGNILSVPFSPLDIFFMCERIFV